jgi:hypothetical protein
VAATCWRIPIYKATAKYYCVYVGTDSVFELSLLFLHANSTYEHKFYFGFDFVGFVLFLQEVLVVVTLYTHFYCCVSEGFCEENCGF